MGAPVHLCNDSARIASKVDILHSGGGALGQQYKGKGVIVGVIDLGIEYNHINFKDANGKSRVKMVYDAIHDKTYLDPDDIAALTTDDSTETHGTHTTGTAAGSYTKNGYQGMAPEADLVLCGAGQGGYCSDAAIINSTKKIFDYADLVEKPAVVNMSLGYDIGPHDGTDYFCTALNSMKSEGHLIVIGAGNAGGTNMYIKHQSENEDDSLQFKTILYPYKSPSGKIDLWSKYPRVFKVRIGIIDTQTGKFVGMTPLISPSDMSADGSYDYKDTVIVKKYLGGTCSISGGLGTARQRYNVTVQMTVTGHPYGWLYAPVMLVYTKKNETIEAWSNNGDYNMTDYGIPGYIAGTDSCSANSLAYGTNTICVGGYTSKLLFNNYVYHQNIYVKDLTHHDIESGDIIYFSSYGIKDDGTVLPDIVAPCTLISSLNSYNRSAITLYICDSLIADDGHIYYWGAQAGTSMATPVVTGIIATWLQCKPTLTVDEIKTILDATALDDYYVKKYNHVKSGRGKIDAYAGLRYLLTTNIGNPECVQHQVLIYPSADGKVNIYAQGETGNIHVGVYAANGMTVLNRTIATTDGSATLDLGNMPKGLYIIKVEGVKARGSNTLTVR
jgi:subtilisin family serine protease